MKVIKKLVTLFAVFFTALFGVAQVSGGGGSSGPTPVTSVTPVPATPVVPPSQSVVAPPVELPMIMSSGALRTYAFNSAREVNAGLGSASISNGGYDFKTWLGAKSQVDIAAMIDSLRVKGDTVNTADIVSFYVSVNSADGQVFSGYTEATPVQTNGVWALPASMKNVKMNLAYSVPINLGKQISWANTVSKDSNGNTRFDQLGVNGSVLNFPSMSVGLSNAYVQVNWMDGTSSSYTITTGILRQAYPLEMSATSSFANVKSFTNPAVVSMMVASQRGVGVVPTIEIITTVAAGIAFDVVTSEGKRPVKFWWKPISGTTWVSFVGSTGTTTTTLPAGTTYVVPEWNSLEFTEGSTPASTGGGKG